MITISLGHWRDLRIAPDKDGVEQLYLVHTEEGGLKELETVHIGPANKRTLSSLEYAVDRMKTFVGD